MTYAKEKKLVRLEPELAYRLRVRATILGIPAHEALALAVAAWLKQPDEAPRTSTPAAPQAADETAPPPPPKSPHPAIRRHAKS
jgi:hypothetical protein